MSKQKARGTAAETAVVRWLQCNGYPDVERRTLSGIHDKGDIAGLRSLVIEVKDHQRMELAGWVAEAERERVNAQATHCAVIHKRRGKGSPGDWYVTLSGDQYLKLLALLYGGGRG